MVKRRKVLLGLGSIAAGGAAGLGTGAFTTVSSGDRSVDVNIAADSESFLQIYPSSGPNGAYAEENADGKLELHFDENADTYSVGTEGTGVNPGSVYEFDDVFRILNRGTQEIDVWVERSNLSGVYFYWGEDSDQSLHFNGWDGLFHKPESFNPSQSALEVGVKIVADELDTGTLGEISGSVSIHAGPAGGGSEVRSQ